MFWKNVVQKDRWTLEYNIRKNQKLNDEVRSLKRALRMKMQDAESDGRCYAPAFEKLGGDVSLGKATYARHRDVEIKKSRDKLFGDGGAGQR
jgi:hypothetical protein